MEHLVRNYLVDRAEAGQIFCAPDAWKEGYDYLFRGEAERDWPTFVAKEAMYGDYMISTAGHVARSMPMSEFFRLAEKYIYPYGRDAHTSRKKVTGPVHVGEGRILQGKLQRTFLRLPTHPTFKAFLDFKTGKGTLTERAEWGALVRKEMADFGDVLRV